jgi:hypothetical protein
MDNPPFLMCMQWQTRMETYDIVYDPFETKKIENVHFHVIHE